MDEPIVYGNEELRRKLLRYRGKPCRKKPTPADKSTTFQLWDIFLLAKVNNNKRFYDFLMGRTTFGPVVRARLSKIVDILDGGYATKTQYGVYHFYDKPVAPVHREMTINLGSGGIKLGIKPETSIPKMPSFMEMFKGE